MEYQAGHGLTDRDLVNFLPTRISIKNRTQTRDKLNSFTHNLSKATVDVRYDLQSSDMLDFEPTEHDICLHDFPQSNNYNPPYSTVLHTFEQKKIA